MLEEQIVFLAGKDEPTGALLAYNCESEVPSDLWVVRQMVRDVEDWGRPGICGMSEGEPAMLAMRTAIAAACCDRMVPGNSPPYGAQSNAGAEKAVQDITDMAW